MSARKTSSVINSWETVRYELLNTRVCDLGLCIKRSPVEKFTRRLVKEIEAKRMVWRPEFYLTDTWGCPDRVPLIGIPFYLADKRLARIEEEQTGEIEDPTLIMTFLRHEAGHAINYAYRLWEYPVWTAVFGTFTRPYMDEFRPNPLSRDFVRHLVHSQYGRHYAQKHPDEDFAETFAVWLKPDSNWRRRYAGWPVLRKLECVAKLMRQIRSIAPPCRGGPKANPIENITMLLAEHYGERAEHYRAAAQGYVDDKLRDLFPPSRAERIIPAARLVEEHKAELISRATRWSYADEADVAMIVEKIASRAGALELRCSKNKVETRLKDLTALVVALAMDFAYTGRFTS